MPLLEAAGDQQALWRHPRPQQHALRRRCAAKCTPSSARTAPANRPSSRSSAGAVAADEGELQARRARPTAPRGPGEARQRRHQPGVPGTLARSPTSPWPRTSSSATSSSLLCGTISQRELNEQAEARCSRRSGSNRCGRDAPVRTLSIGDRQLIEIVKGLANDPEILILDEATSALLPREVDWLLDKARERAAAGKLVLYISHRHG